MRLIDADAAKKSVIGWETDPTDEELAYAIDGCPTIDAVPVVLCRDCKWWMHTEEGIGNCTNRRFHLDGHADPSMKADDFCSCGERSGNE